MFIIDSHNHLGDCRTFGYDFTENDVFEAFHDAGIEGAILQPFPGCTDVRKTHNRIAKLAQDNPGKFFGLSSVNPHLPGDEFEKESIRAIKELGFKGVKMHTVGHAVNPLSKDGGRIVEMGKTLGVPLCIHTGTGMPFSLPSLALPIAKSYPYPVVLAHAGAGLLTEEAIVIAQQCENLYLEMSWCAANQIQAAINAIGSSRVMFGSDSLINLKNEINKFMTIGLKDVQLEDVFYKSAKTVYGL